MKQLTARVLKFLAPLALCSALAAGLAQKPAHADLMFTNHSAQTIYVAIGWLDPQFCGSRSEWRTKGWYAVERGQTVTVFYGNLSGINRYWLYHAMSADRSVTWSGEYYYPVRPNDAFDQCLYDAGNGVETKGFRLLDVESFYNYTMTLY